MSVRQNKPSQSLLAAKKTAAILILNLKNGQEICHATRKQLEYALRLGLINQAEDTQLEFCSLEKKAIRYKIQQLLDAKIKKITEEYVVGDIVSDNNGFSGTIVRVKNTRDEFRNNTISYVVQISNLKGKRKLFRHLDVFTLEEMKIVGKDEMVSGFHHFCNELFEVIKKEWRIEKPKDQATVSLQPNHLAHMFREFKKSDISMQEFINKMIDGELQKWEKTKRRGP